MGRPIGKATAHKTSRGSNEVHAHLGELGTAETKHTLSLACESSVVRLKPLDVLGGHGHLAFLEHDFATPRDDTLWCTLHHKEVRLGLRIKVDAGLVLVLGVEWNLVNQRVAVASGLDALVLGSVCRDLGPPLGLERLLANLLSQCMYIRE